MNKTKCPKCGYEWNSKGKLMFICCPNCRHQFKKEETIKGDMNGRDADR